MSIVNDILKDLISGEVRPIIKDNIYDFLLTHIEDGNDKIQNHTSYRTYKINTKKLVEGRTK